LREQQGRDQNDEEHKQRGDPNREVASQLNLGNPILERV
jgi:hypothetical protein